MIKKGYELAVFILIALLIKLAFFPEGCDISDSKPRYRVEAELEPYLESFVSLASLKGLDLSYVYESDITIVWEHAINPNRNNVATSYGRDKDKIIIVVNKERFYSRTEEGRKYVMFHEFGHDILNFKHLESPRRGMMEPTAYTGFFKNYDRFTKEIQEKYLYRSLNKMFDRFLGDAIVDDAPRIVAEFKIVRVLSGNTRYYDEGYMRITRIGDKYLFEYAFFDGQYFADIYEYFNTIGEGVFELTNNEYGSLDDRRFAQICGDQWVVMYSGGSSFGAPYILKRIV